MVVLRRNHYEDFISPVLDILDSLGGEAWLSEIKVAFHKKYYGNLETGVNWDEITKNQGNPLWEDHCGSRVSFHHLGPKKKNLITIERHGNKGSVWKMTDQGRAWLRTSR